MPAGSRGILTGYLNLMRRRLCQQDPSASGYGSLNPLSSDVGSRRLLLGRKRCALRSHSELWNDESNVARCQIRRWRLG